VSRVRILPAIPLCLVLLTVLVPDEQADGQEGESSGRIIEDETPQHGRDLQNYVTWNVWQGVGWSGALTPTLRFATRIVQSRRYPRAVAGQEMCYNGFLQMKDALNDSPLNYDGAFYESNEPTADTDCNRHGNGIFWRGGCYGGLSVCVDRHEFAHQGGEDDTRGWACGRSSQYDAFYCSAHMSQINTPQFPLDPEQHARLQSVQYRQKSEFVRGAVGIPTVFMGDFNIEVEQSNAGMQDWYQYHREADACSPANTRTGCFRTFSIEPGESRSRKYDYIFASKPSPQFCSRADDPSFYFGPYGSSVISDHVSIRGYFGCP